MKSISKNKPVVIVLSIFSSMVTKLTQSNFSVLGNVEQKKFVNTFGWHQVVTW